MAVQKDMERLVEQWKKRICKTEIDRSYMAKHFLERFDLVAEEMKNGDREAIGLLYSADFILPSLRKLMKEYLSNGQPNKEMFARIAQMQAAADEFLKQNGYDATVAREQNPYEGGPGKYKAAIEGLEKAIVAAQNLEKRLKGMIY